MKRLPFIPPAAKDKSVLALRDAASELIDSGRHSGLSNVHALTKLWDEKIRLYKLSKKLTGQTHSAVSTQLPLYLQPAALELLRKKALNDYWFWAAVRFATNYALSLPLSVEEIQAGIAEMQSELLRSSLGRYPVIAGPKKRKTLFELTPLQLAFCVQRGLVMIKRRRYHSREVDELLVNPLFS